MAKYLISALLFSISMWAQDTIETDRPDQTETAATVPTGKFQSESGFLHRHNGDNDNEYQLPETLWKFGLNSKMELRLITTLSYQKSTDSLLSGLEPVTVGFKVALWEQKGVLPKTSVIGHLELSKVATKELQEARLAPEVRFLFKNDVTDDIEVGYNLGVIWDGESGIPQYAYTLAPDFKLGSRLSLYVEEFAYLPAGHHLDHWVDGGFKYLITNNVQVDISGGYELSLHDAKHRYFEAVGVSFRI